MLRAQRKYLAEISLLEKIVAACRDKILAADAFSLLGEAYRMLGVPERAVKNFVYSAALEDNLQKSCAELSNAIFAANDSEYLTATHFHKLYHIYQKRLSEIAPLPKPNYNHEKIRVGYLSADFCLHPVLYFVWALLTRYDKNRFAVYCYSAGERQDNFTEQIKNAVVWRDISKLNDIDAAKLIRADEIDILIELSGHTSGNRLPITAHRPARVQISGIGYMNSTGLDCVDYFISDKFCAGNSTKYFTEKIIRLPNTHFCYTPLKEMPEPSDAPCVKSGCVTFGCFNNFSKVTDSMLSAWQKILGVVKSGRLILKHKIFDSNDGKEFVVDRLRRRGFDISRITLRGFTADYLNEYHEIDIALDTFPYCGGLTTCEALYMGVPVISLYGDRHGTRFGYSLLKNVGVEELAVTNVDDYIRLAIELAGDYELLSLLHKNLRGMMQKSPLMNEVEYVRAVESEFRKLLWRSPPV